MLSVYKIKTFPPAPNSRGGEADFEGTYRKGELRGIIRIDQDSCVGCDTCRSFCPTDAIDGSLGVAHKIDQNLSLWTVPHKLPVCRHRADKLCR